MLKWASWMGVATLVVGNAGISNAASLAGVNFPDSVQVGQKSLVLNGLGIRKATFLKVKVYVAALYLEKKTKDAESILRSPELKQVVMHFVRNVETPKLREALLEGFEKNCKPNCEPLKPSIEPLLGALSDMHSGDTLTFTFFPDHLEYLVKGKTRGSLKGAPLSNIFLSIWLGRNPPNDDLKSGMLGLEPVN